jgi:hypothetical protein
MLVVFLEVGRIIAEHAGGITPVALELGGHFLKDAAVATAAHAVVGAIYEWWERRGRPTIAVELPDGKELRLSQSSTDPKKVLAELEPALTNPSSPS